MDLANIFLVLGPAISSNKKLSKKNYAGEFSHTLCTLNPIMTAFSAFHFLMELKNILNLRPKCLTFELESFKAKYFRI